MKKFFWGLIFGLLIGVAAYWYLTEQSNKPQLAIARQKVVDGAGKVKDAIQEKVSEIRLEDIKEELTRSGMVVREKAKQAGEAIADATADARTTAAIKTKLSTEVGLSTLNNISVNTSDGLVTLSGTVTSHEDVAKAVRVALETEGVHKVVSTLQVKPAK
jgi:osmotically-inducible protein OsmY